MKLAWGAVTAQYLIKEASQLKKQRINIKFTGMKKVKNIITKLKVATIGGQWFVYMVECSDKTIYTGITNDVTARIAKHNSGKGAKYTRAKLPVVLKVKWKYETKSDAAKAEYAFKQLSREEKLQLINGKKSKKLKTSH
jgi:putative endonuclease